MTNKYKMFSVTNNFGIGRQNEIPWNNFKTVREKRVRMFLK